MLADVTKHFEGYHSFYQRKPARLFVSVDDPDDVCCSARVKVNWVYFSMNRL